MTGHLDVHPDSPAVQRLGVGAVALRWQRLGFSVLGLGHGSKRPHPLVKAGVLWADTDPAAVDYVWARERTAGIGIATGLPGGLLVVDLDRHGEYDGRLVWQRFLAFNGMTAPAGPWVSTPSGGEHRYYRLPPGVTVPTRTGLLPSVDIKAAGGYVVAPPSMIRVDHHSPGEQPGSVLLPYVMHGCPCELPVVPLWLLTMVMNAPGTGNGGDGSDHEDLPELAELYDHGLPAGLRNVGLHRLACQQYRRYGSSDRMGAARAAIDAVLDRTDRGGFSAGEAERTIASARSFVARQEAGELAAWQSVYGRR